MERKPTMTATEASARFLRLEEEVGRIEAELNQLKDAFGGNTNILQQALGVMRSLHNNVVGLTQTVSTLKDEVAPILETYHEFQVDADFDETPLEPSEQSAEVLFDDEENGEVFVDIFDRIKQSVAVDAIIGELKDFHESESDDTFEDLAKSILDTIINLAN